MKNLGGESLKYIRKNFIPVKNKLLNKHSEAEEHFKNLLDAFGEYYVREKAWFKINTEWSYYDFYIPYYRVYIEIDGKEHRENMGVMKKDRLKEKYVRERGHYIARFTNEEVLNMTELTFDILCQKIVDGYKGFSHKHTAVHYLNNYKKNLIKNREFSMEDIKKVISEEWWDKKIYMYDAEIDAIFEFENIFDAKLRLDKVRTREIIKLTDGYKYARSTTRRYVFGRTKEECEENIIKVFG